jgi:hypothetical protein
MNMTDYALTLQGIRELMVCTGPPRAQSSSSLDPFLRFVLFLQYQTYHFVHRATSTRVSFSALEKRNDMGDSPRKRCKHQEHTVDTVFHRPQ